MRVDRHAQRRRALPHSESDLRDAFFDGRLDEHPWCELKRELAPSSKGSNLELARDLASLGVDGGSLYIGVDEKAPEGDPLRPQLLAGLRERVDQVARSRVTPALFVECYEIPASGRPGYGYLEVVVPASADAPHQVDGIYYGRSDTGKCRLSDQQVERLMRERDQQRHGAEEGLRALMATDPYTSDTRLYPHLFVYARPGARRSEMFCDVIGADLNWQPLVRLLSGVINDVIRPMYATTQRGSGALLETLILGPRLITGGVTLASWPRGAQHPASEADHQELRIDEDGDLSFFHARVGWDSDPVNDVTHKCTIRPHDRRGLAGVSRRRGGDLARSPCLGNLGYRDCADRNLRVPPPGIRLAGLRATVHQPGLHPGGAVQHGRVGTRARRRHRSAARAAGTRLACRHRLGRQGTASRSRPG